MTENWIIPCNVGFFDIIQHFKESTKVVWKNSFTIREGDIAYIYLGRPYGEIRYKCIVISDNVDAEKLKKNSYAIPAKKSNNYFSKKEKYIEMELICEYSSGIFTLENLRKNGLGQVQIQARVDRNLQQHLNKVERECMGGEVNA